MEEQIEIHDNLNVEYGVILPIIAPECQWMTMSNEEAKTIADRRPDRFFWFCNVDPSMLQNLLRNLQTEYIMELMFVQLRTHSNMILMHF